jgi:hypothetical protein
MDLLKTYFRVLQKETELVAARYGWDRALLSSGFLTDLVPGLIMGYLFFSFSTLNPLHLLVLPPSPPPFFFCLLVAQFSPHTGSVSCN